MGVDKNVFFREATLRICGSLDVATFLRESFNYIRRFVPAESVFLTYFDSEKGEHVALATASSDGGSLLNLKVPMPEEVRRFVERPDIQTLVIERAETHPTAQPWISKGLLDKNASLLVLRLIVKGNIIGALTFHASGSGIFAKGHAHLLSLLREPFSIALSNSIRYQELHRLKELLAEDNRFLHGELRQAAGDHVIGAEFGLREVMEMVRQVAPLASPVILIGETGTGKEVIANAIHRLSSRKDGPYIKVNCGAIPETLIDSELFGHEKGAFTGALSRKRGRFERAHEGSIFLDEVGELRPEVQVRLLRVLEDGEVERVGGAEPVHVDIRVIAATHRDLETMVDHGEFRDDLYFRLKVFPIMIPPLRERKGDIPLLVQHFIETKSRQVGVKGMPALAPGALERLTTHSWPGNVRELENAIERSLILNKEGPLRFDELQASASPPTLPGNGAKARSHPVPVMKTAMSLDGLISQHIRSALEIAGGKIGGPGGAADLLGINPSTLRKRMRKLGIPFGRKAKRKQVK
jgi:formate hydrogenlyase transcriptional activator